MYLSRFLMTNVMFVIVVILALVKNVVNKEFTDEWAVQIIGGEEIAKEIAERNNFEFLGKIFDDVFHFRHRRMVKRSANPSYYHHENLVQESAVKWAEQQRVLRRVKRDLLPVRKSYFNRNEPIIRRGANSDSHYVLSDPKWPSMWYLNRGGGLDMNVERAWKAGITGKGIVVTILDDGLEKDHPDLIQNYDPNASYDVNSRDPDPEPRYDLLDSNRHGTRCAGEVAATANNSLCSVGVAFEASVGGVRMLDGDVTDAVEARSLALNPQHIDVYSASWGPDDDGKTVDGPGQMATRAFIEGISRGRNGKGSIFVWASGNGGRDEDNCNCDGYTNSIWTLSISSATENGRVPWYSEACSSTLASTYSSGAQGERQIITTDLRRSCTEYHTGTSASAPLAAGICALALHANRELTWRDMQHIVVRTARPENLDAPDWQTNGVGRKVSHRFGYGLMDAYGMVELAKNWTTVPPQRKCEKLSGQVDKLIPQKSYVTLTLEVSDCPGVNYLEHVQAKVSLMADRRGDIEIFLISPAGTKSNLLALRPRDNSRTGFRSWPFMTVHMWGESPLGIWKLEIHNNGAFYSTRTSLVEAGNSHYSKLLQQSISHDQSWGSNLRDGKISLSIHSSAFHHSSRFKDNYHSNVKFMNYGAGHSVLDNASQKYHTMRIPHRTSLNRTSVYGHPSINLLSTFPPKPFSPYSMDFYPQSLDEQHPYLDDHKGKSTAQDWNLIFYGTEVEAGHPGKGLLLQDTFKGEGRSGDSANAVNFEGDSKDHDKLAPSSREQETRAPQIDEKAHNRGISSAGLSPIPTFLGGSGGLGCASLSSNGQCIECSGAFLLLDGNCVNKCPLGYFISDAAPKGCLRCHYSCKSCLGPYDYQCEQCWPDASLYNPRKEESFCYSKSLIDAFNHQSTWFEAAVLLFLILFCILLLTGFFLCRTRLKQGSQKEQVLMNSLNLSKMPVRRVAYSPVAVSDSDGLVTQSPISSDDEV